MKLSDKMNKSFVRLVKDYEFDKNSKEWKALFYLTQKLGRDVKESIIELKKNISNIKHKNGYFVFDEDNFWLEEKIVKIINKIFGDKLI